MRWICIGSGPSLTPADVDLCRSSHVIAINNAVDLAPWAEVCFGADYQWWQARDGLPEFKQAKVSMYPFGEQFPDVFRFKQGQIGGFDHRPGYLATGNNSGFSAINFAVKDLRATEVLLLGYDMQPTNGSHHFHAPHNEGDPHPSYARCIAMFDTLVSPLTAMGVTVYNCSVSSAITAFPKRSLRERLLSAESLDHHPLQGAR